MEGARKKAAKRLLFWLCNVEGVMFTGTSSRNYPDNGPLVKWGYILCIYNCAFFDRQNKP